MPGVKVITDFPYTKRSRKDMKRLRRAFDRTERKKFLQSLNEVDLRRHGFTDAEIERIKSGRVPRGYQVHHKSPLDDSGTNSPDNLVLIRNSPEHQLISNHQRWVTRGLKVGGHGRCYLACLPTRDEYLAASQGDYDKSAAGLDRSMSASPNSRKDDE